MTLFEIEQIHAPPKFEDVSVSTSPRCPDVALPRPFSEIEQTIIEAYWSGRQVEQIVVDNVSLDMVRKTLYGTEKHSLKDTIYKATNRTWMPRGVGEIALWWYKHGFLPKLEIDDAHKAWLQKRFSESQLDFAHAYLSGITQTKGIIGVFGRSGGAGYVRGAIMGNSNSVAEKIHKWTNGAYYPGHKLAACLWMVKHGVISEHVIGEALS